MMPLLDGPRGECFWRGERGYGMTDSSYPVERSLGTRLAENNR